MNAQTVKIQVGRKSHAPYGQPWATPVGWTPKIPTILGTAGELTWADGVLWDETEEVAGIVWRVQSNPEATEGDVVEVPLDHLWWAASGMCRNLGNVEIA
jgi:hypothetical protein